MGQNSTDPFSEIGTYKCGCPQVTVGDSPPTYSCGDISEGLKTIFFSYFSVTQAAGSKHRVMCISNRF